MPDAPPPPGPRVAALALLAAALHALFDAASAALPVTTPPYLRLADAPEAFQLLSPVAVSVAASCVSGVIAAIAVVAVEPARGGRALALSAFIGGFWLFSAALTRLVWLSTPWPTALVGIAAGVPRGLAIGWVLARLAARGGRGRGAVDDPSGAARGCRP